MSSQGNGALLGSVENAPLGTDAQTHARIEGPVFEKDRLLIIQLPALAIWGVINYGLGRFSSMVFKASISSEDGIISPFDVTEGLLGGIWSCANEKKQRDGKEGGQVSVRRATL